MYRGTTPQIKLKLDADIDFSDVVALWVTFKSCNASVTITKTLEEVTIFDEANEIRVDLTQEETLELKKGPVMVQVRFRNLSDKAYATSIAKFSLENSLKEGVI